MTFSFLKPAGFLLAGLSLAACAQTASSDTAENATGTQEAAQSAEVSVLEQEAQRTVKPGANLAFDYDFTSAPELERDGTVTVIVSHGYMTGTLELVASGSDNLQIQSAGATKTVSLRGPGDIEWPLSYRPLVEGKSYINIHGRVTQPNGASEMRAFALPVQVGEIVEKPKSTATEIVLPLEVVE